MVAQQKLDGVRVLVTVGDDGLVPTNRDGQVTQLARNALDGLAYLPKGTIVDGDVGAFCYGMEAEVLRCPWHNWEFDVKTGESLHDHRRRLASRPVEVIDGNLYV